MYYKLSISHIKKGQMLNYWPFVQLGTVWFVVWNFGMRVEAVRFSSGIRAFLSFFAKDKERFHVPGLGKHIHKRNVLHNPTCLQDRCYIPTGVDHIA